MTEAFSKTICRVAAVSLFASIIPIWAFPSPTYAVTGFTGAFELNPPTQNFWIFTNTGGLATPDPQAGCDTIFDPYDNSCLDNSNYASGSISIYAGVSATGTTDLTWPGTQNISPYYVSFSLSCSGCNDDNFLTYTVGDINNGGATGTLKDSDLLPVSAYLGLGSNIEFSISNSYNYDNLKVDITQFNAVPGPLPAAGAATAFGYSRRLRRRIKGVRPAGSNKATVPSHPSVYLNLPPCRMQSLPVSFSYGNLPGPRELERPTA